MNELEAAIRADLYPTPCWLPQAIDRSGQWVRMARFTEDDYRRAPFLDVRGLRKDMERDMVGWALLQALSGPKNRSDAHWIFHISHAGSTLISRLVGECGDVLCLREPLILRSLMATRPEELARRLPIVRRLLSRCFRPSQRAIVKASSNVSELAIQLVGPAADGGKALFVSMSPRDFVVGRLSRDTTELAKRTPARLQRLKRRLPDLDTKEATSTKARVAAMSWACEASSIEAAMGGIDSARWRFLDFATFLQDPAAQLAAIVRHLGIRTDGAGVANALGGPLMHQHAKLNSQAFTVKEQRLAEEETAVRRKGEIDDALAWLGRQRRLSGLVDRACARFD